MTSGFELRRLAAGRGVAKTKVAITLRVTKAAERRDPILLVRMVNEMVS